MSIGREIEDIQKGLVRHQHDHPPVRDLNAETDRRLSRGQRVADDFAHLIGSWPFVALQVILTAAWLVLNLLGQTAHWDPAPFPLLNLVLTFELVAWVSVSLMAVNRLAYRDRLRAQHDFEMAVKSEEETRAIMTHLEVQDEILVQVLHRLDRQGREQHRLARRLGVGEDGPGGP